MSLEVRVLLQGVRITPFERPWSTTTKIKSYPSTSGRLVIKSIEQITKGQVTFAPLSVCMLAWLAFCQSWIVDKSHIPVHSLWQRSWVLATSDVVILHYKSQFHQDVWLFDDHGRFLQCPIVVQYPLVYSFFPCKKEYFVHLYFPVSNPLKWAETWYT